MKQTTAMIALVISVIALIFALVAYTATTEIDEQLEVWASTTTDDVSDVTTESYQELKEELVLTQTRMELALIELRYEAGEAGDELSSDVNDLRRDWNNAMQDAATTSQQTIADVDTALQAVEVELREEGSDVADAFQNAFGALEQDISPDQQDLCEAAGGTWKEFSNACADTCGATDICAQVLTTSCECPSGCWNGTTCIAE